ncbi:MAG: RecQ family ATP-dependent DNA helicase, partial [Clostridiales bacterium]|nr:RecQ family ATP-dependent DNA helicase [Clostridiales bacterium]
MNNIIFVDVEVSPQDNRLLDIGAVGADGRIFHSESLQEFTCFARGAGFFCGHNIIEHDMRYIGHAAADVKVIDTLYFSPLLFPEKPYHALVKDDKLQVEELNNPVNDAIKARDLFYDEIAAFNRLSDTMKDIFYILLRNKPQFSGFFEYLKYICKNNETEKMIKKTTKICGNAPISEIARTRPIELAYAIALIATGDPHSLMPPWVHRNFSGVSEIMNRLRNIPCGEKNCAFCAETFGLHKRLKDIFGYEECRVYNSENLQEQAAAAALGNKSLLAVFPTGGGKSITFQLPALIAGEAVRGITVVISPLQSLMKDQVDNLAALGIPGAVTINGLLSPIERTEALQRAENGIASILYISPEQLRSNTIERLLLSRHVVRFVIDEAHCFSSWGQDFRVDYLYIGDFIRELAQKKNHAIPVSCFTATAKQKVISDIREYFKEKLNLDLKLYSTDTARKNLRYQVLYREETEKYSTLRDLISSKACPTIVYVSRTKRSWQLAQKLTDDGHPALPFHGRLDSKTKVENQNAFMNGDVNIVVATKAFGMGVDKKDVGLIIHYDISDSLEDYVQESGRAGRDESIDAICYVLFNDNDLNRHFIMLNQTKLSINEINQVWRAIKQLTRERYSISRSPLEIARLAGWDDSVAEIETRVKTAISALETAGYLTRGKNSPHVFATSILAKTMMEASEIIQRSPNFDAQQKEHAARIMSRLFSSRSTKESDKGESRVDYLADSLGIPKQDVIASIGQLRESGLLSDTKDLTAYIYRSDSLKNSIKILDEFIQLEDFLIQSFSDEPITVNLKEINSLALENAKSSVKNIKTLLFYWVIK